ncbi:uncharacterized protein YqkB [Paenibacillus sp. DS2015]|uniref:iron-sulfur cluster biosynthesis family protein n=1 Tax=Paenibacillus sp. DS2015 TaxID=3373917 RepID=UPI003D222564
MIIQLTPLAEDRLKTSLGDQPGYFKLFYDTEGCGCDGISVLLIINGPDSGDINVDAGLIPLLINPQQAIYYEEFMRLDADPNYPSFKLSSDSMVYSTNVTIRDIR